MSVVLLVYYVIKIYKKQCSEESSDVWAYLLLWMSVLISISAVAFTTTESSMRYYFMIYFVIAFCFSCFMKYAKEKSLVLSAIGYGIVIFLLVFQVKTIYFPIIRSNEPSDSEEYMACQYLEENNYKTAYADFERANTMTALSGGSIRVAAVASLEKMDICKWLSSTEWYVPNVPYESRTAYIVTEAKKEDFEKFYKLHYEDIWFEAQFGNIYIYGSDYNFSCLE